MMGTASKKTSVPPFLAHWLCGLLSLIFCASPALAAESLEKWRSDLAAARALAENDVQQAYPAAQRLQLAAPPDALPSDRARALNLVARIEVYAALTEQAEKHAQLALDIAQQANDRPGQAEAQLNIALNSVNQAKIDASVAATTRSAELLDGADRPELLGEALLRMSMMYRRLGDMDNSVTMAMQAMDIAKRSQNPFALTYAYQGMAISFEQSGHYREAYDNYQKMRDQASSAHSRMLEAHAIHGMAVTLQQLGDVRGGESMMRAAIGMYRSTHAPFSLNFGLFGLADMLSKQGRHKEALSALDEVVANYRKYPNQIGLWFTLNARSLNLQSLHRMRDARADALRAYELAQKIGLPLYLGGAARRLSELYAAEGDYPRAFRFSAEAIERADQAVRQKSSERMVELAERYETDSKQRLIDELKRHNEQQDANQRWLWTVLIGSAALLLLTSFFLIRLRRSRREIQLLNIGLEQRVQARTAELRQQSRYLRTLFDTLPISVWLKDTAGRYLTINSCQVALDGIGAEQMIGKTDEEIWPGEIGAAFRAADIEVMETRRRKTQELAIPGSSGEICWREIDKAPVIDDDGTLLGTVGVGRDISERKRYEQSLLAQAKLEQRLSSVAANIPGFIFTFRAEPDGRIRLPFASPGIEEMLGLSPDQVSEDASALRARYHPDDLPRVVVQMNESRQDLTPFNIELRMFNRDDELRWIAIHSIPQRQDDESTEWNGIMLDITERKRIEEALRLSQENLADAQRIAHVGSWEMNLVDNVLSWSDEIYRIFEINPQQFGASYEAFIGMVHPDDRDLLDRAYKSSLERHERFEIEHRLLLQDGRIKYVHERCENYYDDNGIPLRSVGTVQDITERNRMEEALAAREREFRSLAENSPDPIFRYDRECRRIYVNPVMSHLSGHAAEALTLATPADGLLLSEDEALKLTAGIRSVFDNAKSVCINLIFVDRHGNRRDYQMQLVPELNGKEEVATVLGLARDITDLKRYETAREAALMEAERLVRSRSEFIAQMSHELRTPLNGILGYAQILGRDKRLDERQLVGVNVIRESGEHLLALINDILDFAKIDAGKIEISPVDFQPDRFLHTIAGIIRIKADEKRLEFSCTLAPEIPVWIHADEKRLRQVLLNLLSNAVKFTEHGQVSLRVDVMPSGRLRFEVRDTGIGIEADQLGTIFEPFEQVGDQLHRHSGTGLGLPISRQFVRLMGGDIHVDSKPGQGSAFWFELDVAAAASGTVAEFPMRAVTGYAGARRTILVVDDERENRAVVVQMLGELDFDVIEAEDGDDALRCAARSDLILIDSMMPKMDGLEVIRCVRRLPGCETLPVIAVSASADSQNEAHCLEAGADAFLSKPIDMTRLLAQIAELLKLEWRYEQAAPAAPLVSPQQDEMKVLHGLALIGNMRDILRCCERIADSDPRCIPFAERLRALAHGYQTRAILEFVEQYLNGEDAS